MIHLVQISNGTARKVAIVDEPHLRCLNNVQSIYELVQQCLRVGGNLSEYAQQLLSEDYLDYNAVYSGTSDWHLLAPIDVPGAPSRLIVTGTGLTHLGSAKDRQAMHIVDRSETSEPLTDSMRMFRWGVEAGRPESGKAGVAPEWFYKGTGSMLQPPFAPLTVPHFAEDGGEEAELAGIYIIGEDARPYRIGMSVGNEFSDHKFEKLNYLNLAGSKLRSCSLGPELVVGADFQSVNGEVTILRDHQAIWSKSIATGEDNMCHSLANLEHHHFKFEGHRQQGEVHVHFFGAHSLSFGEGIRLQNGDWMDIRYDGFGRPLRNPVRIESGNSPQLVQVTPLL